ncbi:MAG: hypothetical protein KGL36_09665 [Gammaproteobacteria bacterium]|nr:hypothetical protein [Gammaproteobacteria bacterium]
MYTQPSAPRTIGGVLDDAITLYRECLPRSWPLALAPEVVLALTNIHLESQWPAYRRQDPTAILSMLRSTDFVTSMLLYFVVLLIFNLALTDHMHAIATGRPASNGRSLGVGLRLLPRAAGASLVIAFATAIGTLLLIVPGIYLAGALMLTFVAMIVGDLGALQSLGESYRLIKGHWWRAATIYTVATMIALAFYLILGLLAGLGAAQGPGASALAIGLRRLASVVIGTLMTMWFPAVLLSIYYDLALRRPGVPTRAAGDPAAG